MVLVSRNQKTVMNKSSSDLFSPALFIPPNSPVDKLWVTSHTLAPLNHIRMYARIRRIYAPIRRINVHILRIYALVFGEYMSYINQL